MINWFCMFEKNVKTGRRSQRPQQQISVRERPTKLASARTLSTEDSINSNRRGNRCSSRPLLVQGQRSSTSSNSRNRNLAPSSTTRERRKSLQKLHLSAKQSDQVQVEVEIVQDTAAAGLRHQLTSDGDDTLNNIRVPSLERDEEAAREEVSASVKQRYLSSHLSFSYRSKKIRTRPSLFYSNQIPWSRWQKPR